jgi:hypothetical protein
MHGGAFSKDACISSFISASSKVPLIARRFRPKSPLNGSSCLSSAQVSDDLRHVDPQSFSDVNI